MVYNQFTNIASDIDKYIVNSNKERFYTKNVKDILKLSNEKDKDTSTHIDLKYKCFECPF
jgi:predicted nucleotidyltransferase